MQTMFCTACDFEMRSLACDICMRVYVGSDGENMREKELKKYQPLRSECLIKFQHTAGCTYKAKKISDCRELVRRSVDDIEFSCLPSCPEKSSPYLCRLDDKDYFSLLYSWKKTKFKIRNMNYLGT